MLQHEQLVKPFFQLDQMGHTGCENCSYQQLVSGEKQLDYANNQSATNSTAAGEQLVHSLQHRLN